MALVFYTSPQGPVQCRVEISRALKAHPRLQLRMGVMLVHPGNWNTGDVFNVVQAGNDVAVAGYFVVSAFYELAPPITFKASIARTLTGQRLAGPWHRRLMLSRHWFVLCAMILAATGKLGGS